MYWGEGGGILGWDESGGVDGKWQGQTLNSGVSLLLTMANNRACVLLF